MPNYTLSDVREIHDLPLPDLLLRAQQVHREHHRPNEVQLCSLLSVKTGGCPEDCSYCPQSSHYDTGVRRERQMSVPDVVAAATRAQAAGATRFCMGSAGRNAQDGEAFDNILKTRTYDDRLATLARVRKAGIKVCSGGIIGMGESIDDRCAMLVTLANLEPPPESVPINALVPVKGTPLQDQPTVDPLEMVRMIATARIVMPRTQVRLSAGRTALSREAQVLCFMAGANSFFFGDKLLVTGNPDVEADQKLLRDAGMRAAAAMH